MSVDLNASNFGYFAFKPYSPLLSEKDQKTALALTIIMSIFCLIPGLIISAIVHAVKKDEMTALENSINNTAQKNITESNKPPIKSKLRNLSRPRPKSHLGLFPLKKKSSKKRPQSTPSPIADSDDNISLKKSDNAVVTNSPSKTDGAASVVLSSKKISEPAKIKERLLNIKERLFNIVDSFFAQKPTCTYADIWTVIGRIMPFDAIYTKAVDAALERIGSQIKTRYENGKLDKDDVFECFDNDPLIAKKFAEGRLPELTAFLKTLDSEFDPSEIEEASEDISDDSLAEAQLVLHRGITLYVEKFFSRSKINTGDFRNTLDGLVGFAANDVESVDFAIQELFSKIAEHYIEKKYDRDTTVELLKEMYQHPVIGKFVVENRERYYLPKDFVDELSQTNQIENESQDFAKLKADPSYRAAVSESFDIVTEVLSRHSSLSENLQSKKLWEVEKKIANFLYLLEPYAIKSNGRDSKIENKNDFDVEEKLFDLFVAIDNEVNAKDLNSLLSGFENQVWLRDYIISHDDLLDAYLVLREKTVEEKPASAADSFVQTLIAQVDVNNPNSLDLPLKALGNKWRESALVKSPLKEGIVRRSTPNLASMKELVSMRKAHQSFPINTSKAESPTMTKDQVVVAQHHESLPIFKEILKKLMHSLKNNVKPPVLKGMIQVMNNQDWLVQLLKTNEDLCDPWLNLIEYAYSDHSAMVTEPKDKVANNLVATDVKDLSTVDPKDEKGNDIIDFTGLDASVDLDDDSALEWPEAHLELDACLGLVNKNLSGGAANPYELLQTARLTLQKFLGDGEYAESMRSPAINGKYDQLFDLMAQLATDKTDATDKTFAPAIDIAVNADDALSLWPNAYVELDACMGLVAKSLAEGSTNSLALLQIVKTSLQKFWEGGEHVDSLKHPAINDKYELLYNHFLGLMVADLTDTKIADAAVKAEDAPVTSTTTEDEINKKMVEEARTAELLSWVNNVEDDVVNFDDAKEELKEGLELAKEYKGANPARQKLILVKLNSKLRLFLEDGAYHSALENDAVKVDYNRLTQRLAKLKAVDVAFKKDDPIVTNALAEAEVNSKLVEDARNAVDLGWFDELEGEDTTCEDAKLELKNALNLVDEYKDADPVRQRIIFVKLKSKMRKFEADKIYYEALNDEKVKADYDRLTQNLIDLVIFNSENAFNSEVTSKYNTQQFLTRINLEENLENKQESVQFSPLFKPFIVEVEDEDAEKNETVDVQVASTPDEREDIYETLNDLDNLCAEMAALSQVDNSQSLQDSTIALEELYREFID